MSHNQVKICCRYNAVTCDLIELPDSKVWEDVKDYCVRWGSLFITWKDNTTSEIDMESDITDAIDWKYPQDYYAIEVDENGEEL